MVWKVFCGHFIMFPPVTVDRLRQSGELTDRRKRSVLSNQSYNRDWSVCWSERIWGVLSALRVVTMGLSQPWRSQAHWWHMWPPRWLCKSPSALFCMGASAGHLLMSSPFKQWSSSTTKLSKWALIYFSSIHSFMCFFWIKLPYLTGVAASVQNQFWGNKHNPTSWWSRLTDFCALSDSVSTLCAFALCLAVTVDLVLNMKLEVEGNHCNITNKQTVWGDFQQQVWWI